MATVQKKPMTSQFPTYNTKLDKYNMPQSFLTDPSQNVLISDQEKVGIRPGIDYMMGDKAGDSGSRIESAFDWINSSGGLISVRAELSALLVKAYLTSVANPNGAWETIMGDTTPLTAVPSDYDQYWDNTQQIDQMVWVDGSTTGYTWTGATAALAAITSTTLTCQGTQTFAQQRFLISSGGVRIKDDNGTWHRATVSGATSSTTITLSTDLTAFPFSGGNLIVQEVVSTTNFIGSTNKMDFLKVANNQAWIGCRTSGSWFVSSNLNIASFSFSTPRLSGEGAQINTSGAGRAVGQLKSDVILHTANGLIYKSNFQQITVGTTLAETLNVVPVKTTGLQAAQHQDLLEDMGNGLIWMGQDNVLYELLDATLAYNPDLKPVSDPVKPTFDALDFGAVSGNWGHIKMLKNRIHISVPRSSLAFIYEYRLNDKLQKEWFWQPPQIMPVKKWSTRFGLLYGHSSGENSTYKIFTGLRDLGGPINAIIALGRWNGGDRQDLKDVSNFFNEGGASENTKISVTYMLELDKGKSQNFYKTIQPLKQPNTVYENNQDPSLGNIDLGDASISGDVETQFLPRFRTIHGVNRVSGMFDYGVQYQTNDLDQQWYLMAHASDAMLSTTKVTQIKVP